MINVKTFAAPEINLKEILRYADVAESEPQIEQLIKKCLDEVSGKITYKVCWREFPLEITEKFVDFGFAKTESHNLKTNLDGCGKAIIFAASLGVGIDRVIAKYSAVSPSKSVIFQAIGAERIESLCDVFFDEIQEKYGKVKPRFSPGYGDFPLEFQREIFRVLDYPKHIGVSLNESLLMSPSKSVTAIIGIQGD